MLNNKIKILNNREIYLVQRTIANNFNDKKYFSLGENKYLLDNNIKEEVNL